MLSYLRIRDLAVIEDAALEATSGLGALTGETGAGKSILLNGLQLATGARAALDQVRGDRDDAVVEAVFDLHGRADVVAELHAEGLPCDGDQLVVRRSVSARGSRAWINDHVVTVALLRRLSSRLVSLVSQHDSQQLMQPAAQLEILDRAGGTAERAAEVAEVWRRATAAARRLAEIRTDERDRAQRADYLRFQIDEIHGAGLSLDEEAGLADERRRLRHSEELGSAATEALEVLYELDGSVVEHLALARARVAVVERLDPAAAVDGNALDEARFSIEEVARALQAYRDSLEADPGRLEAVEERLASIDALRRKYGDSVAEILERAQSAEVELASLQNRDQEVAELTSACREISSEYDRLACALTASRETAAASLAEHITAELQGLGMAGARFHVRLRALTDADHGVLPPGAGRNGYEGVEFLLAANPGESPKPLARVASGGELSRVMLALELAASQSARPQVIVFDEIDAGIGGGRVADRIAARLAQLAEVHQVLVVTHLPQVAARARTHFLVSKKADETSTRVAVARLDTDGRIEELARMLGGVEVTASLREHARELLTGSRRL